MPNNGSFINFRSLTAAQYAAIATKDVNALYWLSDVKQIYLGENLYSQPVVETTSFEITTPAQGTLYVNTTTYESRVYIGTAWKVVSLPVAADENAADDTLLTTGIAKQLIADSTAGVGAIYYVEAEHALVVTANGDTTSLPLSDLVSDVEYNAETAAMTFKVVGKADKVINLPKENFLSAANFDDASHTLTLTLADNSSFDVDLAELIDVYTFTGSDSIEIGGTAQAPTFAVKLDPAGNIQDTEAGLKVDLSGITSAIDAVEELVGDTAVATQISNAITTAKSDLKGDAATEYDTLGKVEDKIEAEVTRATEAEGAIGTRIGTVETTANTAASDIVEIKAALSWEVM